MFSEQKGCHKGIRENYLLYTDQRIFKDNKIKQKT